MAVAEAMAPGCKPCIPGLASALLGAPPNPTSMLSNEELVATLRSLSQKRLKAAAARDALVKADHIATPKMLVYVDAIVDFSKARVDAEGAIHCSIAHVDNLRLHGAIDMMHRAQAALAEQGCSLIGGYERGGEHKHRTNDL